MPDTPTTRVGLYKSASDGSEDVDYTLDLGQNWDKVDAAVGFQIVTSGTRPGTPYAGKPIAESDTTYRTYFSNGTSPASASWVQIPNASSIFNADLDLTSGKQLNIGSSSSTASLAVVHGAAADDVVSARVTGDTQSRLLIEADGAINIGPGGSTAPDVRLYRSAADTLALDDDLAVNLAGKGLRIKEGSNARMGVSTLVAGTVVVLNASVTTNSRIFLTCQTPGGTPGFLRISARTASTSFTILSSSGSDTSVVGWLILEPA